MTAVLFAIAAGTGAATRHAVNQLGWRWLGTFAVNVVGAFVLGALVGSDASDTTVTVLGTGLCGSLTTFSTFSLEATEGPWQHRATVIVASVVCGVAAAAAGYAVTS